MLRIGQLFEAFPHGNRMVGDVRGEFFSPTTDLDKTLALCRTNPFDPAARKLLLIGHVKQPILEAGRSEVCHQNLHDPVDSFRNGSRRILVR